MYTSYVRQTTCWIYAAIICLCSVKCVVLKKNCSSKLEIYEENFKNCLVNASVGKTLVGQRPNIVIPERMDNYQREPFGSQLQKNIIPRQITAEQNETIWELSLTDNINIRIARLNKETMTFHLTYSKSDVEGRKRKTNFQDVIPYLIIPGFIMAGVVPWLIPGIKLAVMTVGMVNQMAFTSSLFTLIRGYIFDTSQEEHLVYINNGYKKYNHVKNAHKYS